MHDMKVDVSQNLKCPDISIVIFQALVGDKTLAFWMMDKEMYTGEKLINNISKYARINVLENSEKYST